MEVANTLDYYDTATVTTVKRYTELALGQKVKVYDIRKPHDARRPISGLY